MNNSLYRRLAKSTRKRHKNLYLPFMINGIFLLVISSICLTLSSEEILKRQFINNISTLAFFIMVIFSAIIILSTYNFIQKKKYEENGLYMVLGMERKHIIKIMFWEILNIALKVILIGSILGFVLYKISMAIYLNMINSDINIFEAGIFQNPFPAFMTAVVFLLIYILLFIVNVIKIRKLSAVDLMRESKAGDKKGKFTALRAILGILCLAGGYYISITTENPMKAMSNLFIAVILVIIGTYFAFSVIISGILNILKKRKKFYYKKDNFVAVSGLMFRVKNSSRTLAGITILSTSVMVILTSGLSLYLGTNDKINNITPYDYVLYNSLVDDDSKEGLEKKTYEYLKDNELKADTDSYLQYTSLVFKDEGKLLPFPNEANLGDYSQYGSFANINIVYTDTHDDLFKHSNIIGVKSQDTTEDVKIAALDDNIIEKDYKDIDFKFSRNVDIIDTYYYLTNNKDDFERIKKLMTSDNEMAYHSLDEILLVNKENDNKKWDTFSTDIPTYLSSKGLDYVGVDSREEKIQNEIEVNSSIFFMGILLGLAFLVSTAIFIYYKQVSEGYDDIERFRIMRQVGMTDEEAKLTVRKQIGLIFILPVAFTIIHTAFAIPILNQFLRAIGLANLKIMLISMALAAVFYIIFYTITFMLTEKVYMNLILEKNK